MRIDAALAPIGVVLALLPRAAAASPQARLVYGRSDGAEVCPDESALRRAVAARVGYDPFFPTAPKTVIVTIAPQGDHLSARIQLVDDEAHAQGARTLQSSGRDCGSLFDTVALTISIAIDPQALTRPSAPGPAVTPAPAALALPPSPPPPSPPSIPEPAPSDADVHPVTPGPRYPRARLGANLRSTLGLAPGPTFGFSVSGGASWRRASLGAEAAIDLPSSETVSAGESVSAWILSGTVVPCLRFEPVRFCGLATVARLQGSASGVVSPRAPSTVFVALGGRIALELRVAANLAVVAQADLLANLDPPSLRVGSGDVWTASPVAGVLGIGAVASF